MASIEKVIRAEILLYQRQRGAAGRMYPVIVYCGGRKESDMTAKYLKQSACPETILEHITPD